MKATPWLLPQVDEGLIDTVVRQLMRGKEARVFEWRCRAVSPKWLLNTGTVLTGHVLCSMAAVGKQAQWCGVGDPLVDKVARPGRMTMSI